ncbi:glycosyltransferase [Bacillus cereus group sp. TH230-1LC]|nr:glycosyltransferase [Bacillus cereus group sp. TH230-1LC]
MLAPVVIFVYARPDHTKKTIESLAQNYLANETNVYIYSDAPKNEKAVENVRLVREYINSIAQKSLFKSVEIINAESNKGLANSVISGVTEITERYGKAIVVEDDLISSKDFLKYMNDALNYYEEDNEIWSISGYTFDIDVPKGYKSDVYLSYRGCSWGWATWKDRWRKVDWDVLDYASFKNNKVLRKKLNRGGLDMSNMLDLQMRGEIDSWAIRWCYAQSKLDMLTIYPIISRIENIGLDGSGTHSGVTKAFDARLNNEENKYCKFDKPEIDDKIVQSFRDKFGTTFERFVIKSKTYIKKLLRK